MGTSRMIRAHRLRTSGVTFARVLKHPKVTYPAARHGAGATAGASALGV